ncbi:MAG: acyl-CoA thioesterase [Maioricimonas sp. JB049]
MPDIYLHHHTVRGDEIDGQGHVNNVSYVHWMQDAALAHSAAQGWPSRRYQACGLGWVARSHFIEYLEPAFESDRILVRTWITTLQRVSSIRKYEILRMPDEQPLARAETNWAFVRLSDLRLHRIPPEVAEAFVIVPDDAAGA